MTEQRVIVKQDDSPQQRKDKFLDRKTSSYFHPSCCPVWFFSNDFLSIVDAHGSSKTKLFKEKEKIIKEEESQSRQVTLPPSFGLLGHWEWMADYRENFENTRPIISRENEVF